MSKAKRNALLLLLLAGFLILFLAMSLPNLVLSPGEPFALGQSLSEVNGANGRFPGGDALLWLFRGFLALVLILLPVYILYSLVTREGRRRLLVNLVLVALLFLLADYLQRHPLDPTDAQQQDEASLGRPDLEAQSGLSTAIFQEDPPSWLTLAVIATTSILVVLGILTLLRLFQQRRKPTGLALEKLAETAQNTIDALLAGGDFEVTIIHCYQEMSRVIKAEKGIARPSTMTPREFEDLLVSKGLPQQAIRTLTRLFEQVRYGRLPTGTGEENLALTCLTDIVNACGGQHEA